MILPVQNQCKVEELPFLIEELPNELLENIFDRMDWKSLCECSKTCKWVRQFVWLNPRYLSKVLNDKLMSTALKCINGLREDEVEYGLWYIISAYAHTDPDTAITYLDRIKKPLFRVTITFEIVPNLSPMQAKR